MHDPNRSYTGCLLKAPGIAPSTNNSLQHIYNFTDPVFITEMNPSGKKWIETDEDIRKNFSKKVKNKPEEALKCVDELIRRNPFVKEFYQLRIALN